MNIEELEKKLNKIEKNLNENNINSLIENININTSNLQHELYYQSENKKYKELISNFSKAYLEISDFYVGKDLPRKTYLDSKKDAYELIQLFLIGAIFEPYINAYYDKYCT